MADHFRRSFSSPSSSIEKQGKRSRSLSMATIHAQVSVAQMIRDMFQAARTDSSCTDGADSPMENAWLQALYNNIVMLFFGVVIFVLIAVYFVLEPFLHPLLWAVLVGMLLHPFKHLATGHIEQWLETLEDASVPLAAGIFISPFAFFNYFASKFDYYITEYFKLFVVLLCTIICLYLMVTFNGLDFLRETIQVLSVFFNDMDEAISFKWLVQVLVFLMVVGVVLFFVGSSKGPTRLIVKGVVVTMWYIVLSIVANICLGYVGLPLVTLLFVAALLAWLIKSRAHSDDVMMESDLLPMESVRDRRRPSIFQTLNRNVLEKSLGILDINEWVDGLNEDEEEREEATKKEESCSVVDVDSVPYVTGIDRKSSEENLRKRHGPHGVHWDTSDAPLTEDKPIALHTSYSFDTPSESKQVHGILKDSSHTDPGHNDSAPLLTVTNIFLSLITTCLLVLLWRNLWLLMIVLPLLAWTVVKKYILPEFPSVSLSFKNRWQSLMSLFVMKNNVLFPQPIPIVFQLSRYLDNRLLHVFKSSVSPIISGAIIVAMIIGGIGAVVFFILQVQVEVAFSVNMMKQVLNTSVVQSSWMQSYVLGMDNINSSMVNSHLEQFADQGFHYGRNWLKEQVESLVNGSDGTSNVEVVNQILKLYDSFYQMYVFKNGTLSHHHHAEFEGLKEHLLHEAKNVVSDNMETIMTITKTIWSVVSVNLSIGISLMSSLGQLLFSGGTMILNLAVFVTALFYLLAYSRDQYLPLVWISRLNPSVTQSSEFDLAASFAKVIRGVFHASFQRACFYGLYTWLVLSVLGMEMTIVPSVLASVTGAIPFIGPYWVSVPAILELWLIRNSPIVAILAGVLFLIPPFLVDTVINSEIQGGHPYLTGLAIAGGVYFAGLEGAIFGPILLCCLLFLVSFLTSQL